MHKKYKWFYLFFISLLSQLFLLTITYAYDDITWQPFNKGIKAATIYDLTINPAHPNEAYVTTQLGGVYKTTDHGRSWSPFSTSQFMGKWFVKILFNPKNADEMYAPITSEVQILKSIDSGQTWQSIDEGIAKNYMVETVVINPQHSQELYAVTYTGFYKSINGGKSWQLANINSPEFPNKNSHYPIQFSINPINTNIQLLELSYRSSYKLLRSINNGQSWDLISPPMNASIHQFAYGTNSEVLYLSTNKGLFKSNDHGNTWISLGVPEINQNIFEFVVNEKNPQEIIAESENELIKTEDEGKKWYSILKGKGSLGASSNNTNELYFATGDGVYHSENGGKTWAISKEGLTNAAVSNLAIDPKDPKIMYAGTNKGLWITHDGENWEQGNALFANSWIKNIVIDPHNPANIIVGLGVWGEKLASPIYRSSDYGKTWEPIKIKGEKPSYISCLGMNPTNPNQLIACSWAWDILISNDGGRNWTVQKGQISRYDVAFNPKNTKEIFVAGGQEIIKSTDGGQTWTKLPYGFNGSFINSIVIDPTDPKKMYAAGGLNDEYRFFKSIDGGNHWEMKTEGFPLKEELLFESIQTLLLDPNNPQTIYAATGREGMPASGHGVFVSKDSGEHWAPVNTGLTNKIILSLAANNQGKLFAGTYGAGVFSQM